MDCYRIAVGGRGEAAVVDGTGTTVWSHRSPTGGGDSEALCDSLLAALSWTVQRHSGPLVVELPETRLADELLAHRPIDLRSRLSSMIDEARVLLTWFESADVALRRDPHP